MRLKQLRHTVCYSDYTIQMLREKAARQLFVGDVLGEIDILIDGAFVEPEAFGAGL